MPRRIALAGLAALALLAGVARADDDKPWPGPPACSALTERVFSDGRHAAPRAVRLWVQCNFLVASLTLTANRDMRRLSAAPVLYRPDEGDDLACSRRTKRRATCRGEVGQDARIAVRIVLREPSCDGRRLRLGAHAVGGIDCDDGLPCPTIGYSYDTSTTPPGC